VNKKNKASTWGIKRGRKLNYQKKKKKGRKGPFFGGGKEYSNINKKEYLKGEVPTKKGRRCRRGGKRFKGGKGKKLSAQLHVSRWNEGKKLEHPQKLAGHVRRV